MVPDCLEWSGLPRCAAAAVAAAAPILARQTAVAGSCSDPWAVALELTGGDTWMEGMAWRTSMS